MYNYFAILLIIINYVITKYNFIPYPNILSDSPIFIFVSVHVQLKNCRKLNKNFTTEWHSPPKKIRILRLQLDAMTLIKLIDHV